MPTSESRREGHPMPCIPPQTHQIHQRCALGRRDPVLLRHCVQVRAAPVLGSSCRVGQDAQANNINGRVAILRRVAILKCQGKNVWLKYETRQDLGLPLDDPDDGFRFWRCACDLRYIIYNFCSYLLPCHYFLFSDSHSSRLAFSNRPFCVAIVGVRRPGSNQHHAAAQTCPAERLGVPRRRHTRTQLGHKTQCLESETCGNREN
jgi:hypothetical protein